MFQAISDALKSHLDSAPDVAAAFATRPVEVLQVVPTLTPGRPFTGTQIVIVGFRRSPSGGTCAGGDVWDVTVTLQVWTHNRKTAYVNDITEAVADNVAAVTVPGLVGRGAAQVQLCETGIVVEDQMMLGTVIVNYKFSIGD